jgi:hypothetical protein
MGRAPTGAVAVKKKNMLLTSLVWWAPVGAHGFTHLLIFPFTQLKYVPNIHMIFTLFLERNMCHPGTFELRRRTKR